MASSIINSDDGVISGTSGLKSSGGDDGVLVFQSKGTETARINTDKQIVAAAGTASLPIYSTTGDVNTGIYFPAADNIGFATGGTIRGRWTTDGLCFGSDTAAANALDDYEEGTWTPQLQFGNANAGMVVTVQQGSYTKIGRLVHVQFRFAYSTKGSSTGAATLTGLPFGSNGNSPSEGYSTGVFTFESNGSTNIPVSPFLLPWSDSKIYLRANNGTAPNYIDVTNSSFGTTSEIWGSVVYRTA